MSSSNEWTKILVGFLWAGIIGVVSYTGHVVFANQQASIQEHQAIRKEVELKNTELRIEIKEDLKIITEKISDHDIKLTEILTVLKQVNKKIKP